MGIQFKKLSILVVMFAIGCGSTEPESSKNTPPSASNPPAGFKSKPKPGDSNKPNSPAPTDK